MHRTLVVPLAAIVVAGLAATFLASCTGTVPDDGRVHIEASFYPLQWLAQQIGGRWVDVDSLTRPGAEPHDLELTPRQVGQVQDADLVVYLSGFQPAVDEAVKDAGGAVYDVKARARLDLTFSPIEDGRTVRSGSGTTDPHFWLDPVRLAAVARGLGDALARRDRVHAAGYRANAAHVVTQLRALDGRFHAALDRCAHRDLVTSHNAFGYLARRYGLRQVGITGLSADEEPAPGQLAAVTDYVRTHHVRTIYFETLVSPSIAHTVATEAGVRTAVLDPIEGLDSRSQGSDYLQVMAANLRNLVAGQPCR